MAESVAKVSIGMPVYNGEKIIREALDSILAQSFKEFQLTISDNASTDNTRQICEEYQARDPRIRYIRQPQNIGIISNFQFVLDQAAGQYFFWAAADDRRHPKFLELSISAMDDDETLGLVFSDIRLRNLLNGETDLYETGYSGSKKKMNKYLSRIMNECPSLIYGLHRTNLLRKFKLEQYDYMDVHMSHWYELNSRIKTIPLYLYTCGTNGTRMPYSITHSYIDSGIFLRREWKLLRKHFGAVTTIFLYSIMLVIHQKNKIQQNRILKTDRRNEPPA